jgi:hypothetical protein
MTKRHTKSRARGALPPRPTREMVEAMAACYDPTWGYPDRSVGKEWARKSYAALRAILNRSNG